MWKIFWNITGLSGLFGFTILAIYSFIASTFLKKRVRWYALGAILCLIFLITNTFIFPGEEEIAEELVNPIKIYQRGVKNEKEGAFERAKIDYEIVLRLNPQNKKAIEKLQLLDRREIVLTFLKVAKKLRRRRKFAVALVKLKVAEEIAPPPGTLKNSFELKNKIKKELSIVKQLITETAKAKGLN